ncbi:hypothetical protein LJB89_01860 [Tyzzerella sp. OttesenSCG-928-J15]|nr:hypothetical protein [Tyzzerella sp. OttesenSCG-928-J15]
MTRKQALEQAITLLKTLECTKEINQIIHKLDELKNDIPITAWTKETIFDTLTQFTIENNRNPTVTDLKRKLKETKLPPHPVIKHRFGMTAKEFLQTYYPQKCNSKLFSDKTKDEWCDFFVSEYYRIKPTCDEEYNEKRETGSPSWQFVAGLFDIKQWSVFKEFLKLPTYNKKGVVQPREKINLAVHAHNDLLKEYEKVIKNQISINKD